MMNQRKVLLSIFVLVSLLMSLGLAFNIFGNGVQHTYAQAGGVTVNDFYLNSGQEPWGTTVDSKGNVWVAVPGCDPNPTCSASTPPGKIEEYNPSASSWIATYQLPSGFAQPLFLAFDAQGNLWFPMPMANSIGMLNPTTQTYQQIAVPTPSAGPWDIAIDHNGKIWFTEHYSNKIGELDPATDTITEISTPAINSQPYGIVVDASNNIWFTENNSAVALIGEYTSGGTLNEYKIRSNPPSGLTPHLITIDPGGNVWWTEGWLGMLGRLDVAKAVPGTNNGVNEYAYSASCSSCGTHTSGISVDGYGQVWFDDSEQQIFGSFPDSGTGTFAEYPAPTQNGHPHDGLNVDTQNRIWFTEEFATKLAEAIQNGTPSPTPSTSPSPGMTPLPSPTVILSPSPSPSPGTTIAQDTFQRPNQAHWGMASDGQTWGGDANSASVFAIANNSGQISNGTGIYNAVLGSKATDAEVLFSGSMSSYSNANLGAVLRWTDTNNWYKAYISGTTLVVQKKVNGSTTTIGSAPFTATASTSYTLRFRAVGSTLYARIWQTGTTEPSTWQITVTDTAFASGYCGLRMQIATGVVASYTSFLATAPGGIATPTPSPSPTASPSPSVTPSPTASPISSPSVTPSPSPTLSLSPSPSPSVIVSPSPTSGTILGQDSFQRLNQTHWGTASDGQAWGGDANSVSAFSIVNNTGQVSNTSTTYSAVLGPAATNAEVLFSGSMSNYTNSNLGAVLRWTDSNNWYKAYITGTSLVLQKKVAGSTTIIGSTSFTAKAGTSYTLRFRVVGSTLYAKAWQTGITEPTSWQITVTDTSLASGYCGLRMLAQNGATATYTSFLATKQ